MESSLNVNNGFLYYGETRVGDSKNSPGFKQYVFEEQPLGSGANGVTFRVTHRILNTKQVVKIYFPSDSEDDISNKAREESIKNANSSLAGIIAVTFDAGEYKYPRRLWYSIMESVTSFCTLKEWRTRRTAYYPTNERKFDIENSLCKSSIHTSLNLAAGLLKSVIMLYENGVIHGDLNPGNILWILENRSLDKTLSKYSAYSYSTLGELCPYDIKLIDMGASKVNTLENAGLFRDSYKLYEHMKSFLCPVFQDRKIRFDDWLSFTFFEDDRLLEYGVTRICGVKNGDDFFYITPMELAGDFFRLTCVLVLAFGIITNITDENPILLDHQDNSDFSTLMFSRRIGDAIRAISFDCMIILEKLDKLGSVGRLINWKNVWSSYPFNRIDTSPIFNANKEMW